MVAIEFPSQKFLYVTLIKRMLLTTKKTHTSNKGLTSRHMNFTTQVTTGQATVFKWTKYLDSRTKKTHR